MDERLSRLEAQVDHLTGRLAAFEARLGALERAPAPAGAAGASAASGLAGRGPAGRSAADLGTLATLVGRTLLVLAGAFLLRALTESGTLSPGPGVLLGLAFASAWILMAARVGGQGRNLNATFHSLAFVLIALPLLFEAATRFELLAPVGVAAGLGGFAAVALAVAVRQRFQAFAWVITIGALGTSVMLMAATGRLGPLAVFLILLGVATLWLGYVLDWTLLRWPVALIADLTILLLSGRAVTAGVPDVPSMALAAQILLLVGYLGSFAARTLFLRREVIPFEVAQSVAAIVAGLGGAAYVTTVTGVGAVTLGIATLVLAGGCYGVAVAFIERRHGSRRNFHFYTAAGLVFAMAGWALLVPRPALGLVYGMLGLAAAWAGRFAGRVAFHAHGAVYLTAAILASGLLAHVLYGFGLPPMPPPASLAMLGVLTLCLAAIPPLGAAVETQMAAARAPRLLVLLLAVGGLLGTMAVWFAPAVAGGQAGSLHPGMLATLRTALLIAAILALAGVARVLELDEAAWLVYPLLVLTGLKFLLEDVRAGQASTLFVGFALYGLALILAPRLCRRTPRAKATG
jgi:hypothetical protein